MGRFAESSDWSKAVADPNTATTPATLSSSDAEELLLAFEGGGEMESMAAFMLLRSVDGSPDRFPHAKWDAPTQARFRADLMARARDFYAGRRAWGTRCAVFLLGRWANVCSDDCIDFLLTLDPRTLFPAIGRDVLGKLADAASRRPDALKSLQAVVGEGGELGVFARDALERRGIVSAERLEHFGRLWRETRSAEALDWLYYNWIEFLPPHFPKDGLLAVLGSPTDGEFPDVYWAADSGGHVYLEVYEHGLAGCHHT